MKRVHLLATLAIAFAYTAAAHAQSIVGAWTYGNTSSPTASGTGVFVFLSNNVYFHAESENTDDADGGNDGMERGTYSWNESTSTFTFESNVVNTNGGWGLSGETPGTTLDLSFSGSTFSIVGDAMVFTKVTGSNSLVGAWTYGNTSSPTADGTGVFVFLSNNVYFHMESENTADADGGNNGMERGTYSWDEGTGTFTFNSTVVNTNGGWGLSDETPGTTLELSFSGNTFNIVGDTMTFTSVSAIPEPSTYAALAGLGALGLAFWQRRRKAT